MDFVPNRVFAIALGFLVRLTTYASSYLIENKRCSLESARTSRLHQLMHDAKSTLSIYTLKGECYELSLFKCDCVNPRLDLIRVYPLLLYLIFLGDQGISLSY